MASSRRKYFQACFSLPPASLFFFFFCTDNIPMSVTISVLADYFIQPLELLLYCQNLFHLNTEHPLVMVYTKPKSSKTKKDSLSGYGTKRGTERGGKRPIRTRRRKGVGVREYFRHPYRHSDISYQLQKPQRPKNLSNVYTVLPHGSI